jgi:hypothetical protein
MRLLGSLQLKPIDVGSREPPFPDVLATFGDRAPVAIEVTVAYAGEHEKGVARSQTIPAIESRLLKNSSSGSYALWHGTPNAVGPISRRIEQKCSKTYDVDDQTSLWLLVACNLAEVGKASTFLMPDFVRVDSLNAETSPLLEASKFERVFLQFHLPPGLFEWTRTSGWNIITRPKMFEDGNPMLSLLRATR